jgi:hypothetical protein
LISVFSLNLTVLIAVLGLVILYYSWGEGKYRGRGIVGVLVSSVLSGILGGRDWYSLWLVHREHF